MPFSLVVGKSTSIPTSTYLCDSSCPTRSTVQYSTVVRPGAVIVTGVLYTFGVPSV
jgi:hypothetical protein